MRRAVAWAALAGAAGLVAAWRRRRADAGERVELYFDDGSMISLDAGTADAARLLELAADVLAAAWEPLPAPASADG